MKSIQQANIDDAIRRMEQAKSHSNKTNHKQARTELGVTLEAIKHTHPEIYEKYIDKVYEQLE